MEEWFTILKFPILKMFIGDQSLFFIPGRKVSSYEELMDERIARDLLDIIKTRQLYESKHCEKVRLYDYFLREELLVNMKVLYYKYGFKIQFPKKQVAILFKVTLIDETWKKKKYISLNTSLEVSSHKAEISVRERPSWGVGFKEEVTIKNEKFYRIYGLFTTEKQPFFLEDLKLRKEFVK